MLLSRAATGLKLHVPLLALLYYRQAVALRLDRRAVTAIEYALIASLVAIAVIAGATGIGTKLSTIFGKVSTEL